MRTLQPKEDGMHTEAMSTGHADPADLAWGPRYRDTRPPKKNLQKTRIRLLANELGVWGGVEGALGSLAETAPAGVPGSGAVSTDSSRCSRVRAPAAAPSRRAHARFDRPGPTG